MQTDQNLVGGSSSAQKVLMFEDDDTEPTQLFEKIKKFNADVANVKDY